MIEMENEFVLSHCGVANSFTQMFNTFVIDSIRTKSKFSETLNEKMIMEDDR